MLALMLALLSFVPGPVSGAGSGAPVAPAAADWPAGESAVPTLNIGDLHVARAAGPCCETLAEPSPDPCPPGEPCAPGGGCCACVSCAKRVADAPTAAPERRATEAPTERVAAPESTGIDGEEAVWHPPRG